ncbi:MAG TPA: TetR/AcrR family transcriptional regulator [Microlunatus sp.]
MTAVPRPRSFSTETAVDAAIERFRGGTFSATSTEELCDCTGLSRSSFYNAFGSKSELFRTALARYGETQDRNRAEFVCGAGTGREQLEALLRETIRLQFETPDHRPCLVLSASVELGRSDDEIADLARRNLNAFAQTITELIERGQCDGSITSRVPAADLAAMLHAMVNGLQIRGRVCDDDVAIQSTIDTALRLL